jgi:hypothetical protein
MSSFVLYVPSLFCWCSLPSMMRRQASEPVHEPLNGSRMDEPSKPR